MELILDPLLPLEYTNKRRVVAMWCFYCSDIFCYYCRRDNETLKLEMKSTIAKTLVTNNQKQQNKVQQIFDNEAI